MPRVAVDRKIAIRLAAETLALVAAQLDAVRGYLPRDPLELDARDRDRPEAP